MAAHPSLQLASQGTCMPPVALNTLISSGSCSTAVGLSAAGKVLGLGAPVSQVQCIKLAQGDVCWIRCCTEGGAPVIFGAMLHKSSACGS